jgi:hypothetical protein
VLEPDGRAVFSVWVPAGPINAMIATMRRAMAAATGSTPDRFAWHDPEVVGALAARHGAGARVHEGKLAITAQSAESYFDANERSHPMSLVSRPVLERAGSYGDVREQALAILREGNEAPEGFRVSSPYRVIEISR